MTWFRTQETTALVDMEVCLLRLRLRGSGPRLAALKSIAVLVPMTESGRDAKAGPLLGDGGARSL